MYNDLSLMMTSSFLSTSLVTYPSLSLSLTRLCGSVNIIILYTMYVHTVSLHYDVILTDRP